MAQYLDRYTDPKEAQVEKLDELINSSGINFKRYRYIAFGGAVAFAAFLALGLGGLGLAISSYATTYLWAAYGFGASIAGVLSVAGAGTWLLAGRKDRQCQKLVKLYERYVTGQKRTRRWNPLKKWLDRTIVKQRPMNQREFANNTKRLNKVMNKCIKKGIFTQEQFNKLRSTNEALENATNTSSVAPKTRPTPTKRSHPSRNYVEIAQSYNELRQKVDRSTLYADADLSMSRPQDTWVKVLDTNGNLVVEMISDNEIEGMINQIKVVENAKDLISGCYPFDMVVVSKNAAGVEVTQTATFLDRSEVEAMSDTLKANYEPSISAVTPAPAPRP